MKLIVLGSGTSIAHAQRASPAIWLETEGRSILLDCGVDAPHRMAEENLDWPNVDAIWISHLHLDHFGGLAPFLFGVKWAARSEERTKPLIVFGCQGIERLLKTIDEAGDYKLFHQSFPIQFHELAPSESSHPSEILGIRLNTISTFHRPESLALHLIDSEGTTLVYTSDTGYSESVAEFARDVDLMILECSFWQNKPSPRHLELADAMRMAKIANPRSLLLNHLYYEWDGIDLESKARELWPGNTVAARDGLRLEIKKP